DSDVFEITLPITVFVLSDDDFLQDEAEERAAPAPELGEEEQEVESCALLTSSVTPSSDSNSSTISKENKGVSNKENSVECSEDNYFAESVCNSSKLSLSDGCEAGTGKY
ncbi:hypothetical protein M959_15276, partial [Chaetura pelagica]